MFFLKLIKNPKFVLVLTLLIVIPFISYDLLKPQIAQVLAAKTPQASPQTSSTPSPSQSPSPEISPATPTPLPNLSKSSYTIAVYGDSMVDTMGERLEYLENALKLKYPQTQFKLYNYGIGSQNVEQGISRFNQPFSYQDRNYPPITQIKADVIVLGSFAYNPFPTHDKNRHYSLLSQLVSQTQNIGADVYILAEIAPLQIGFGKGPNGVNWPEEMARPHVERIIEQIENSVSLSKTLNLGLINTYQASKVNSKYGNPTYVNPSDGIHPSQEGHVLVANLIVKTVKLK